MKDNNHTTVVLADDQVIVRQGIKRLLEDSGIHVIGEASDGLEAIKLIETLNPDFLICDMNMGPMNGLEVTRRVAKQFPQIKINANGHARDDQSTEIGGKLFISPRTVDIHRANLMHKLGLRTRIELVQIAQRQGILPPEFEIKKD